VLPLHVRAARGGNRQAAAIGSRAADVLIDLHPGRRSVLPPRRQPAT
jgi:hypothetical protein